MRAILFRCPPMAIPKTSHLRGRQLTTGGHGSFFASPVRKRYRKKTGAKVYLKDSSGRYQGLHTRLLQLRNSVDNPPPADDMVVEDEDEGGDGLQWDDDAADMDYNDGTPESEPITNTEPPSCPPTPDDAKPKRRILPNEADLTEYEHWQHNVGQMVDDYLSYTNRSLGKPAEWVEVIGRHECECVELKETSLTCLYYDRTSFKPSQTFPHLSDSLLDFRTIQVPHCACRPIHQVLVHHGLFPSAPQQPRITVSLELLGLYRAMFERSCDAVNALANALHSFYTRRGFHVLDAEVRSQVALDR